MKVFGSNCLPHVICGSSAPGGGFPRVFSDNYQMVIGIAALGCAVRLDHFLLAFAEAFLCGQDPVAQGIQV
jgi:hypothetical protein